MYIPILTDIIPGYIILLGIGFFIISAIFLKKTNFFYNYLDPTIIVFFQILFTFFVLVTLGLMSFGHILSFISFLFILLYFDKSISSKFNKVLITEKKWIEFSSFFFVIVLIMNIYLFSTKGLLLFQEDVGISKVEFYQGAGIFKRINQVAVPIFALVSFYRWYEGRKQIALIYIFFSVYLLTTLGSKAALIDLLFIFGAYSRFKKIKINYTKMLPIFIGIFSSSLFVFYLIYGDSFIGKFGYRIITFSDGPVYYFYDNLSRYINYPLTYMFDQFFVGIRIQDVLKFDSLGPLINSLYFNFDNELYGPNPQIFVEADVMMKNYYFFYYAILAMIFILGRKLMATPFSFILMNTFISPLLIDSQYAFSNLFSLIILLFLFFFYSLTKKLLLINERF